MNYIQKEHGNITVSKDNQVTLIHTTLNRYLNQLCMEEYSTLQGRIDAIRKKYKWVRNTPVYVSEKMIFLPINSMRCYENILINIVEVIGLQAIGKQTKIVFDNGEKLIVQHSKISLDKKIKRIHNDIIKRL